MTIMERKGIGWVRRGADGMDREGFCDDYGKRSMGSRS